MKIPLIPGLFELTVNSDKLASIINDRAKGFENAGNQSKITKEQKEENIDTYKQLFFNMVKLDKTANDLAPLDKYKKE